MDWITILDIDPEQGNHNDNSTTPVSLLLVVAVSQTTGQSLLH